MIIRSAKDHRSIGTDGLFDFDEVWQRDKMFSLALARITELWK